MTIGWEIKDPAVREAEAREKLGNPEYERRVRIAAEKVESMPACGAKWKEQLVLGGQFETVALACTQKIFNLMAEKDHKFWSNLVYKLVTGK